jgi:hypothetical protein
MNKKSESYKNPVGRPATGKRKINVNVSMALDTEEKLTKYSKVNNRSKSDVVNQAVDEFLKKSE